MAVIVSGVAFMPSCSEDEARYVPSVDPTVPTMTTVDVDTYVSDSGYMKYHAVTPLWEMYDNTNDPHWLFPVGLSLDTYDPGLKPNAHIECDSAKYWTARRVFRLDGDVMVVNVARDTFLTEQLYWDQAKTEFYTDSFIHIVKSDRIIEGYGFTSNEAMSRYVVHRPTAIIPASSLRTERNDSTGADTSAVRPVRGIPVPASEREASRRAVFDNTVQSVNSSTPSTNMQSVTNTTPKRR